MPPPPISSSYFLKKLIWQMFIEAPKNRATDPFKDPIFHLRALLQPIWSVQAMPCCKGWMIAPCAFRLVNENAFCFLWSVFDSTIVRITNYFAALAEYCTVSDKPQSAAAVLLYSVQCSSALPTCFYSWPKHQTLLTESLKTVFQNGTNRIPCCEQNCQLIFFFWNTFRWVHCGGGQHSSSCRF